MNARYKCRMLAVVAMLAGLPAAAEDIELFVNANPQSNPPNVLFVIDTAANFSANAAGNVCRLPNANSPPTAMSGTVGGIEQCALYRVISALPAGSVNIGVMMYNASGVYKSDGTVCPNIVTSRPGGCLTHPITFMNSDNKAALLNWILNWKTTGTGPGYVKSNGQNTGGVMQEAWAYFNGRKGLSGQLYSAVPPTACNNYVLFIGNSYSASGSPGDQTGSKGPKDALNGTNPDALMNASPAATTAQRTEFTPTLSTACGTVTLGQPHENNGYYADEWARYMNADGITTYTIGLLKTVGNPKCQQSYAGILTTMADLGGGKYFPTTNYDELVTALQTALSEMLSVNSVFASVSLPVSVNTEGTYLNQVFIGMFRPDGDAMPRWLGNLKQYRLGRVGDELRLLDARNPAEPAISSAGTGFVSSCARSYWTPSTPDDYWKDMAEPNCQIGDPDNPDNQTFSAQSNTPDGNVVEKGAQGYVLRGSPTAASISRNIKTCNAGCTALANFDTGNAAITAAALGVATAAERDTLINWARGQNNKDGEDTYVAATAMRPSVHGDVVHSRPVAINFEPVDANPPQVAVFYGGNDGVLRAVNGNRDRNFGSVPPGQEIWSFVPPEFYPQIDRLRKNNRQIDFDPSDPDRKPYGFDGAVTAYAERDTDPVWIFSTMRRGGRAVYAFDVADIDQNTPVVRWLWKFGCSSSNDASCTAGATKMGQSWAAPKVIRAMGYGSGTTPMLIMGGGYDDCEDYDPDQCTNTNKGNVVYLLNAANGAILKTFQTERGVVGDVTVVTAPHPDDVNQPNIRVAVWAYLADLGGNVYRISGATANSAIENAAPANWTITKIADLGCASTADCDNNRKFFFGPDVVYDAITGTYVLLVGSGDREKPVSRYSGAYAVDNYFFSLRDKPTDSGWLAAEAATCSNNSLICLNSLYAIDWDDATPSAANLATKPRGWALGMRDHEQVVTSAITVFGTTTFSTHIPEPAVDDDDGPVCTNDLGTASVYNVGFSNAAPPSDIANRFQEVDGGGLPPSPVAGQVELDDGEVVPFIIGSSPRSALEGGLPTAPALSTRPKSLTYWYLER